MKARLFSRSSAFLFGASLLASHHAQAQVVISQVFGGGGNSGASVQDDYIELFNEGAASVSLNGYSLQYASSTGSSWQVGTLPAFNLQPGQFFLVKAASGTAGSPLGTTPDATIGFNMSGSTGKVALVANATALTGSCPIPSATIPDFVGYGTANCSAGNAPAPAESSVLADVRRDVCTDANNNAADFVAQTAGSVHNSSSPLQPCGGAGVGLRAVGVATPATVTSGDQTLLTVSVSPVASGDTVIADLSAIGAGAGQMLYDDGTHGDLAIGDGTYSLQVTVASATAAGPVELPVTAMDDTGDTTKTNIALTVTAPVQEIAIHTIQGENAKSTYAGQVVATTGIVTGIRSNGFFIQTPDGEADGDSLTPEGIFVFTSTRPSATVVAVGNEVKVTGKVAIYPPTSNQPGTELDSPQISLVSSGNALPAAIVLTGNDASPTGTDAQLERYQSMLVSVNAMVSTGPTDASLTETTETNTSNGEFFAIVQGIARPFREPGIDVNDILPAGAPADIPRFDDNPERIEIDSSVLGGTPIDVTSNTSIMGVQGIVDYSGGQEQIDLLPTVKPVVGQGMSAVAVPVKAANEFTVASFNMERFYDVAGETAGATKITQEAFSRRLAKASLAVRTVLNMPDIIGIEEMENIQTLTALSAQISADAQATGQADPKYQPFLQSGNDPSGINVAFLVKTGVTVKDVTQYGKDTTYTNPANGTATELNDRPPLVLHALVGGGAYTQQPITVIANHLRSLIDIDDPTTGATVRAKREAQAEYLANLIQGFQQNGESLVSVGDYNAFGFSDGYVDTVGAIRGNPAPANQVVLASPAGLVNPILTDLEGTIAPLTQQYSYVEDGSAQTLDHVLVTQNLVSGAHMSYGRMDADFPLVDGNDATTPLRVSDHDPAVAYFPLTPLSVTLSLGSSSIASGQTFTYTVKVNTGAGTPATGTVDLYLGSQKVNTVTLTNGTYTTNTNNFTQAGTYTFHAHYNGDSIYSAVNGSDVNLSVHSFPFTLQAAKSLDPHLALALKGKPFAYRVQLGDGSGPALHGQLSFYAAKGFSPLTLIGSTPINGSQLMNGDVLNSTYTFTTPGIYTIYGLYSGDPNYAGAITTTPLIVTVL